MVASISRIKNIPAERVQYAVVTSTCQKAANISLRSVNLLGGILSEGILSGGILSRGDFVATPLERGQTGRNLGEKVIFLKNCIKL